MLARTKTQEDMLAQTPNPCNSNKTAPCAVANSFRRYCITVYYNRSCALCNMKPGITWLMRRSGAGNFGRHPKDPFELVLHKTLYSVLQTLDAASARLDMALSNSDFGSNSLVAAALKHSGRWCKGGTAHCFEVRSISRGLLDAHTDLRIWETRHRLKMAARSLSKGDPRLSLCLLTQSASMLV